MNKVGEIGEDVRCKEGVGVCRGGVDFVKAFKCGVQDREVQDGVVVHVEQGVSFESVKLEEVFGSGAEGGVVLSKMRDR